MACSISIDFSRAAALKNLSDYCGTNSTLFYSYITEVFNDVSFNGNLEFTDDFKKYVGDSMSLDLNSVDGEKLKDKIISYYNNRYASVYSSSRDTRAYDKVRVYGYSTIMARQEAKSDIVETMLRKYRENETLNKNKTIKDKKSYYKAAGIHNIGGFLMYRLSVLTKIPMKEIQEKSKDNFGYIQKLLDDNNANIQLQNLAATYNELVNNDKFIDEVLLDSRVNSIIKNTSKSEDDEQNDKAANEELSESLGTVDDIAEEADYDTTIRVLDNKIGTYTDFMTHLGGNIKSLLGSLEKLNSGSVDGKIGGKWDYNLDNNLGLPTCMNANECATVLYHYGNYTNKEEMMKSIKQIANSLPEFASFHKLYDILNSNLDLQNEFYVTFGKMVIGKLETVTKDGVVFNRISNNASSKLDALRFEYLNSIKITSIQNNIDYSRNQLSQLKGVIKVLEQGIKSNSPNIDEYKQRIEELLYTQLKSYFNNITPLTIKNYLRLYNQTDIEDINITKSNIDKLVTILEKTINLSVSTRTEYEDRQLAISVAYAKNKKLEEDEALSGMKGREYEDMNPLYSRPYLDEGFNKVIVDLSNLLSDYSLVKVNLNSTNVEGNQSSDVINSSMITNLLNTFQNTLNTPNADGSYPSNCPLVNFGEYRFQSQQYDFSNIMLEHKTPTGDTIYGLFREDENGRRVPTEYARDLLSFTLFNGANNMDEEISALYSQMSKGDYIGTAWINFFRTINTQSGINTADYFLRTPSDAPKTFICRAPRYSIKGLFTAVNENEVLKTINDKVNQIDSLTISDTDDIHFAQFPITVSNRGKGLNKKDFINHIISDEPQTINIPTSKKDKTLIDGQTVSLMFRYKEDTNSDPSYNNYVMEGTIKIDDDGKMRLIGATFKGFVEDSLNIDLWQDIRDAIREKLDEEGKIERTTNTNHVIFQALRNAFIQELTDMATAIDVMFEKKVEADGNNIIGLNIDKKGKTSVAFNPKYSNTKHGGLSKNYHFKGKNIVEEKNGKRTLTGNVFKSDRFTVYDPNTNEEKNYGNMILEEAFDFFYGGIDRHNFTFRYKKNNNGKLEVVLSQEQEDVINNYLNQFITDSVNRTRDRLSSSKNFIKSAKLNTDNIAEFILNYHITYINSNDLLEGDSKFYKTSRDFLKRAKEYQGSGVPYGITNFAEKLSEGKHPISSSLETTTFGPNNYRVTQYNRFSAVTVKNTIKTNTEMLEKMVSLLSDKEYMGDNVISEERARDLMYGPINPKTGDREGGYQNTKVNDAQSYITFDEWIRRITARGQLPKYKPLIDKILDKDAKLTVNDVLEFVQVQKNFYYDQYYNEETKTIMPRQIKNAEFVLVPRLIEGTELELVEKLMRKHDIDQLNTEETSKAGKSYVLEVFDEKTGDIKDDIRKEFEPNSKSTSAFSKVVKDATELFNYNYLYTQQETPQHMGAKNKAGIQVVKKLFDNIPEDSPLKKYKDDFFEQYCENIYDSFVQLMNEFNIKLDENGNIKLTKDGRIEGINYKVFYDRLQEELARLGLDSNMSDYFTQANGVFDRDTVMPNYMSLVSSKLENIAQSLFNSRITRQTLPGFHAAQVSGVGFKPLSEQVSNVTKSGDLKYHPNGEPYIEVMLPAINFGFDRSNPAYRGLSKELQDEHFLDELRREDLDTIIGYRIPTEGKQSVCNMKVVGFTDDALGSTIIVPDDWVSQTGSDFDIDSVYGIQYNSYISKDGRIHKVKYEENDERLYMNYLRKELGKEKWNDIINKIKLDEEEKQEIIDKYTDENGYINWNDAKFAVKQAHRENFEAELEYYIIKENLSKFEDFKKLPKSRRNSREARENRILDDMKEILSSPEALEENLSRSNFDDVLAAFDKCMTESFAKERDSHSPYNFLDQADYQEDAMSGAKLKAFSVTRDTMVSVCNTVRPTLTNDAKIDVIYSGDKYNEEELIKIFGKENVRKAGKDFKVTHSMFGWSLNNRNVDGKILTAYSSQTTAHILDAIKSGNIPNVNDLTFQVYKTIVDIGSNYDTAVSFMMQPGIKRIVDAYNSSKSIYAQGSNRNYIGTAIRAIADELGIEVNNKATIDNILVAINAEYEDVIKNIFNIDKDIELSLDSSDTNLFTLNSDKQTLRLQGEEEFAKGTPVEESVDSHTVSILYDLCVILQYNKLNNLSKKIGDLARVSNPDKFGAKQTIFATNEIFDRIATFNQNGDLIGGLVADKNFPLTVNNKHFIEAIYPGITEGLDGFIKSKYTAKDSAYPPLYNFLKYATATSIKVNKTLFITQSDDFVEAVKSLESKFANGQRLDEKTYKAFQNYIISYLAKRTRFINQPLHYNIGKGGARGFEYLHDDNGNRNVDEIERVFGYGSRPDMKIQVGDELVEFNVKNINNPTEDEIRLFEKFSPAQKVMWLQQNLRDGEKGILDYINVSLFNDRRSRKSKYGAQTMEYTESISDIETAYAEFELGFTSRNPLIALTHADILKYAFIVEGYKMGRNNVSKLIKNSVLINGGKIYGTNIVNDMNQDIENIRSIRIGEEFENLTEDFIRSHQNIQGIPRRWVKFTPKNGFDLIRRSAGIVQIGKSREGENILEKYGFGYRTYDGDFRENRYARLTFGNRTTLYKLDSTRSGSYFLIPINALEDNENGIWSVNPSNNVYPSQQYYEDLINKYTINKEKDAAFDSKAFMEAASSIQNEEDYATKYKSPKTAKIAETVATPITKVEKDDSGFYQHLASSINSWLNSNTLEPLVHYNSGLEKHIKKTGKAYGLTDNIIFTTRDEKGNIVKRPLGTFKIYRLDCRNLVDTFVNKGHTDRELTRLDSSRQEAVKILRDIASRHDNNINRNIKDIYVIEPTNNDSMSEDDIMASDILDKALSQEVKSINRRSANDDEQARYIRMTWNEKGITSKEENVKKHYGDILTETAKYVSNLSQRIINDLNYFMKDEETGRYLSVLDPKVIEEIKKNPTLRKKYVELILEAKSFENEFGMIKDVDIASEDSTIQGYLNKIKTSVETVRNSPMVNQAFRMYAEGYLNELSNNPLIKDGMINVLDGFYKSNWLESVFNDIQESPNPIIQITMKEYMKDMRAAQMYARKRIMEFESWFDDLNKRASKEGMPINMNNIVDEYGRFKQEYTEKFLEDRDRLQKAVFDAKEKFGAHSIEFYRARLEYNEWKAENLEQPVVKSYYDEINKLDREILFGTPDYDEEEGRTIYVGASPKLYAYYMSLYSERNNILFNLSDDTPNPELDKRLEEINKEIELIRGDFYADPATGELKEKGEFSGSTLEGALKSYYHAELINDYIENRREIENKYFGRKATYNFAEDVEKNVRIVQSYESTYPEAELASKSEYVKAKTWLRRNTIKRPNYAGEWKKELDDAYETLGRISDVDKTGTRSPLWDYTKTHGKLDEFGVFDATDMTDEEIAKLKYKENQQFRNKDDHPFSDRTLISNGAPDRTVYNRAFYKGFTGGSGKENARWFEITTEINDLLAPYYDRANQRVDIQRIPNNDEGIRLLRKLNSLYDELSTIHKSETKENKKKRIKWIKENVTFAINEPAFTADNIWAESLPKDSFRTEIFRLINSVDSDYNVIANNFLYGYIKPKKETFKDFETGKEIKSVDEKRTKALEIINKYTERVPTQYYSEKFYEMSQKGEEEFNKWFHANHIYNPYTHGYQPLRCWMRVKYGNNLSYSYYPTFTQKQKYIKDGKFDETDPSMAGVHINLTEEEKEKYKVKKGTEEDKLAYIARLRDNADKLETEGKLKAAKELRHLAEVTETGYDSETDFVNRNYKEGGHAVNYKKESHNYDNPLSANKYEIEAMNYIKDLLTGLAYTKEARNYIEKGWLPSRSSTGEHNTKFWMKELLKFLGIESTYDGKDGMYDEVEYYRDRPISTPMLGLVKAKGYQHNELKYPKRENFETEEEYQKYKKEYQERQKEVDVANLELHKKMHDKDYISVIKEFILKASQYNVTQENKHKLFLAKQLIKDYGSYVQKYDLYGDFKRDSSASTEDDAEYIRKTNENLVKQFDTTIQRLVYDQWKDPNANITKWFSVAQSYTSASFMMLNVKGGIANVTLGETQIFAEAMAKEYFGISDYAKGKAIYMQGLTDYVANMYNTTSSTTQGAIIKFFDIVDYDEHNGKVDVQTDEAEIVRRIRNFGYSPQSSGEHAMQNAALFSMLQSHRLFDNPKAKELGQPSLCFMNFNEYTNRLHEEALLDVLTTKERKMYDDYKKKIAGDANLMKDFAWFKEDVTTEFAYTYLDKDTRNKFIEKRDEKVKEAKKEFENDEKHPTIYSQLKLDKNGTMGFADDSKLKELDIPKSDSEPSDAYKLLAGFKGRVISVNKKIHGVYDKSGRAQLERTYWGSLLMQYHKHIPMAIIKRYRRAGMFNEERGTVEKGFYGSIYDFLRIPFKKHKNILNMKDKDVEVATGVQNIIKESLSLVFEAKHYYNMLPEYDRANLRRALANVCGILSSLALAVAVKCIADDDDEDSLVYNMAIYQVDRLATETTQFSPLGYNEIKKTLQSPFAANSIIQDIISSISMIAQMMLQGDEFDAEYHSGQFAGDNKLTVYLQRRIPIWRGIKSSFIDVNDNNHYYKIGKNILGFFNADDIAEGIKKSFD